MALPFKSKPSGQGRGKYNDEEKKIRDQIRKTAFQHATTDKESIGKVAKLELNKITTDNFD